MGNFENSSIWKKSLARQPGPNSDPFENDRDFLRVEFYKFRNKAKILAAEIAPVLPDFTVHDITHIDALWDMADIFLPEDYQINPAEAFVLGGAFLVHDLGMALAAYPDGINELKNQPIWQDTLSAAIKKHKKKPGSSMSEENVKRSEQVATETALRVLHAQKASELVKKPYTDKNGREIYLLDDSELRNSFDNIIGKIAYSHWWRVDELEEAFPNCLGALTSRC